MTKLDAISSHILERASILFPRCAIRMRPFMGGTESICGTVPSDWNGVVITLDDPRKKKDSP